MMIDICPFLSIGKDDPVDCNPHCALFDTEEKECAISRISGNSKHLEEISKSLWLTSSQE